MMLRWKVQYYPDWWDGWTEALAFCLDISAAITPSKGAMNGQQESLKKKEKCLVDPCNASPPTALSQGVKESNEKIRKRFWSKNNKISSPFHLNWPSVILHKFNFKVMLCNLWKIILN